MKKTVMIAAFAALTALASQPAMANSAASTDADVQTYASYQAPDYDLSVQAKPQLQKTVVKQTAPAPLQVRIVRKPVPGQAAPIKSASKGRIITPSAYPDQRMRVYVDTKVRVSTPNLYRN